MDLNADLGEGAGFDDELLGLITSASIACGGHAGGPETMRHIVRVARKMRVSVGAHPGYPDRHSFGRAEFGAEPGQIENWVGEQTALLAEICRAEGTFLRYVKAHGALYNRAVHDQEAAAAIAEAVRGLDHMLVLLAPAGSAMLAEAERVGLRTAREAFLDRAYLPDGSLAPRNMIGAVLDSPDAAADRALALARGEPIRDMNDGPLHIAADSLCVHGDSPAALAVARAARLRLETAGIRLAPFA